MPAETTDNAPGVLIALGANVGDTRATFDRAVALLDAHPDLTVRACSHLCRSAPWGDTDQPEFLNAALAADTTLAPHELLDVVQRVEHQLGRRPTRRWGPRVIDIDILWIRGETINDDRLKLPHPGIHSRPFVYQPLRDLTADEVLTASDAEGRAIEHETERLPAAGIWPSRELSASTIRTGSEDETAAIGHRMGERAAPGTVIGLDGPLGAGKSAFVRGLARGLGIEGPVPSPSYTLCREHTSGRLPLYHWDFYRLEDSADLESTGFGSLGEERGVTAIEWAKLFAGELPQENLTRIRIDRVSPGEPDARILSFDFAPGSYLLRAALAPPESPR